MKKVYIVKDALMAEIEKAIDEPAPSHDSQCPWEDGYYCGLNKAENIIDTLEAKEIDSSREREIEKEMDFEKEFKSWIDENTCNDYCSASIRDTAEHFFELALNANHKQKA